MSGGAPIDVDVELDTGPAAGPLLEVRDLRVHFDHGGRRICAVNGLSYALTQSRNALELLGFTVDPGGSAVLCWLPQLFSGFRFRGFRKLTSSTAPSGW